MEAISPGKVSRLLALFATAGIILLLGFVRQQHRDVTLGFSKEGCEVLGVMKVPATHDGSAETCKLEHVNVSLISLLFDEYMDHVEAVDGSYEFDIAQRMITWREKDSIRHY
ncbi:MAG: hypothetical protein ACJ74Q_15415 [Pyrinomonadaceae bacterium]